MQDDIDYKEWGKQLLDGKCAVISVVGNPGGSSIMCSQIIEGLNGNGVWNVMSSSINVYQNTGIPYRYYSSGENNSTVDGKYDKKLYSYEQKYCISR